ncbi:MAG: DUF2220 domain-containing protein [Treponema sp.]|jgi:hypothetical protein|nr:DUF2220 domain-containing protein [Treponema sp.]
MSTPPDRHIPKAPLLTVWEKRIAGAFAERYPASAAASGLAPRPLRLRPDRIFPDFDRASPDDRESFLEAAEALEKRGILSLSWVRHRKGEALSSLICRDPELLFDLAGKPSPKTTAETVRQMARSLAAMQSGADLFSFIAENFSPQDAALGIDVEALADLARLVGFFSENGAVRPGNPGQNPQGITIRALSVALYRDSKRLEALAGLFNPLLTRARRMGIAFPGFAFPDRSFPETFIAGKITLCFGEADPAAPLVNATGSILALPLGTIQKLGRIIPLDGAEPAALMIENKETFFALAESLPGYACFLYTGGHPNRAVRSLVSLLAESGFTLFHSGDLDPDGILILQELREIAGKPVSPLLMDRAVFDRYRDCGRKLEPTMLRRIGLIRQETRSIPGVEELIQRIQETGRGIEQEIINYRL